MIKTNNGLSKVAVDGFFSSLENKLQKQGVVKVALKEGGKLSQSDVIRWATKKRIATVYNKGQLYLSRPKAA